uniref:Uncharacterized protein n=1 Tax=Moniliophthora roreri TaxID=221103 RepID=A0A0W0G349_MONRR
MGVQKASKNHLIKFRVLNNIGHESWVMCIHAV